MKVADAVDVYKLQTFRRPLTANGDSHPVSNIFIGPLEEVVSSAFHDNWNKSLRPSVTLVIAISRPVELTKQYNYLGSS